MLDGTDDDQDGAEPGSQFESIDALAAREELRAQQRAEGVEVT